MSGLDRLKRQLVEALGQHLANHTERPEVPEAGILLWNAFTELDATRSFGENGPAPLTFGEIETWGRLKGYALPPHQVDIIRAMDSELLHRFQEEVRRRDKAAATSAKGKRKLTAGMFDARFS